MGMTVTVTANRLPQMGANMAARVSQAVRKSAFDIEARAKSMAPVGETGNLKGSITTDIADDGLSAEVTANADYAAHVEYGTRPHVIRPKNASMLAFKIGGVTVFAKEVNHPGTAAQPFMTPAAEQVRPSFIAAVKQAVERG